MMNPHINHWNIRNGVQSKAPCENRVWIEQKIWNGENNPCRFQRKKNNSYVRCICVLHNSIKIQIPLTDLQSNHWNIRNWMQSKSLCENRVWTKWREPAPCQDMKKCNSYVRCICILPNRIKSKYLWQIHTSINGI